MVAVSTSVKRLDLDKVLGPAIAAIPGYLGEAAVDALSAGGSDWPVRTGLSKAGFGVEVDGDRATITNSVDYAPYVEARTGAGSRTVQDQLERIIADADARLQQDLDRR